MALTKEDLREHWHLDKKVPVAIIATLFAQIVLGAMWIGSTSNRMENMERSLLGSQPQGDRLTRVEVKVDTIVESVAEIKANLRAIKN